MSNRNDYSKMTKNPAIDSRTERNLHLSSGNKNSDKNVTFDKDADSIFSLDEDTKASELKVDSFQHFTKDFDEEHEEFSDLEVSDKHEESNESDDEFSNQFQTSANRPFMDSSRIMSRTRHTGAFRRDVPQPNSSVRLPSAAIAASLPVTISRGFWPPAEATDSIRDNDNNNSTGRPRAKTILPQRDEELYRQFQAYSRSIQPADDPERLFGERPRRRYRTGSPNDDTLTEIPFENTTGTSFVSGSYVPPRSAYIAKDLNTIDQSASARLSDCFEGGTSEEGSTPRPRIIIPSSLTSPY